MRLRAVIRKEWEEIIKNKMVFWSLVLLPLLLTAIFLGIFVAMHISVARGQPIRTNGPIPPYLAGYAPKDAVQIMMLNQFLIYFLIAPVTLPIYIAAFSIIGEKQTRTLEPLLATPVRTWELLLGKSVAAVVPPVIAGWLSYALFAIGARFVVSDVVFGVIASPLWLLSLAILGPLFGMLSVLVGVIASSRMNDPRAAQQWSALFLVPLVVVGMAMMMGAVTLSVWTLLGAALALLVADGAVLYFAVRVFQREVILTRWR